MRLLQLEPQLKRNYLYENLDVSGKNSILLWETAGIKLKEAALTADQIQSLFKEIETAQTASGDNRTMLGKGKDAASAVNKAWEDLKTKIQDSGPIKNFDQKVSDVLSKIGMGADDPQFDGQVNKWVQKYRDFAKKHPIAQGAIYATLIALAGITGAGVGGAVALGLLKMSDQLLQGKRFSSAAYSGVKAGAMAFAASKLGDLIKGMKAGDQIPKVIDGQDIVDVPGVPKMDFQKYDYYLGDSGNVVAVTKGAPNPFTGDLGSAASSASNAASTGSNLSNQILDQSLSNPAGRSAARQAVAAALDSGDITAAQGKELIKQIGSAAANPEAAEQAITQTLQNVGGSAAKSAAKSAGTSIADIAASTDIPSVDAVGASSEDLFKVGDQKMAKSLRTAVEKMSAEDQEETIAAWRAMLNPDVPVNARQGAGERISELVSKYEGNKAGNAIAAAAEKSADVAAAPGAADAGKAATKAVKGAAEELLKYVGQEAPDGVIKNIAPDGKWIEYTSPTGRLVRDNFPVEMNGKTYNNAGPYLKALLGAPTESISRAGKRLSEGQVYYLFKQVVATNIKMIQEGTVVTNRLNEGPMDFLKQAAGKVASKASSFGKSLTTKVTAEKLTSAWKKAGSPTDSQEIAAFLSTQGVSPDVVAATFKGMRLPGPGANSNNAAAGAAGGNVLPYPKVVELVNKLTVKDKLRLIKWVEKNKSTGTAG